MKLKRKERQQAISNKEMKIAIKGIKCCNWCDEQGSCWNVKRCWPTKLKHTPYKSWKTYRKYQWRDG